MYCNPYLPGVYLTVQKVPNGLDVCLNIYQDSKATCKQKTCKQKMQTLMFDIFLIFLMCSYVHNTIFCRPVLWYQSKQDTNDTIANNKHF